MKKLILTFCMFFVTATSFSDSIDEGSASTNVKATGTVIDTIKVYEITPNGDGLDMGIMEAGETRVYTTGDTRGGDPHPAVIRIEGSTDSTSGGAIVNVLIKDGDSNGIEDQVTISNTTDGVTESIKVVLSYTDPLKSNDPMDLDLIDLGISGIREITINGAVNDPLNGSVVEIPDNEGLYEGTIYVQVNYDDSTPWF